jgi:hypothetical protein
MDHWIKVITHPLGLAGFALFLAFTYSTVRAGRAKSRNNRQGQQASPWQVPMQLALALIALIGGLYLANEQLKTPRQKIKVGGSVVQRAGSDDKITGIRAGNDSNTDITVNGDIDQSATNGSQMTGIDATGDQASAQKKK